MNEPTNAAFEVPAFAEALQRVGVRGLADLNHRQLGTEALQPYFESFPVPAHSDFLPQIDHRAIRARFMRQDALDLQRFRLSVIPVVDTLEGRRTERGPLPGINHHLYSAERSRQVQRLWAWH